MSNKRRERMLSRVKKTQVKQPPYKAFALMGASLFSIFVMININANIKDQDAKKIKKVIQRVQQAIEVDGPLTLSDTVKTTQVIGNAFTVDCNINVSEGHATMHTRKEFAQRVELTKRQIEKLNINLEFGDITFNPRKTEAIINISFLIQIRTQQEWEKEIRDYQLTMIKIDKVWLISGVQYIEAITRPESL